MTPEEIQLYVEGVVAKRESFALIFFILSPVVTLLLYHMGAYLKHKGQNLATKEDIGEITDKIESAKAAYTQDLEQLRSALSTRSQTTTLRFTKEVATFELIWPKLYELKERVLSLRPIVDSSLEREETKEDRKKKRAGEYLIALKEFNEAVQHNRPFYSHIIWEALKALSDLCYSEAVDWRFHEENGMEYWDKAMENQKEISNSVDNLAELIRQRLAEYE